MQGPQACHILHKPDMCNVSLPRAQSNDATSDEKLVEELTAILVTSVTTASERVAAKVQQVEALKTQCKTALELALHVKQQLVRDTTHGA